MISVISTIFNLEGPTKANYNRGCSGFHKKTKNKFSWSLGNRWVGQIRGKWRMLLDRNRAHLWEFFKRPNFWQITPKYILDHKITNFLKILISMSMSIFLCFYNIVLGIKYGYERMIVLRFIICRHARPSYTTIEPVFFSVLTWVGQILIEELVKKGKIRMLS